MPFVGIGVGIGRQRFASGIFAAYAARVAADGGVTEAGACVDAVSGISLNSSLLLVPSGYKSGVVYSQIPTNGDGDLTFTRASDATRVNSDGEIEVVGSGVPRLDYSQGSCPALLLEPQRTNLVTYSEEFDNADWTKEALSVTANDIDSPDGNQNADLLTANGLSARKIIYTNLTTSGGQSYSLSIYAKKGTNNFIQVAAGFVSFGSDVFANFDLDTGVVGSIGSSTTASIQSVGDGWYRCTITGTGTTTTTSAAFLIAIVESSTSTRLESNSLSTSVYVWGAQLEQGSYATSYIPTTTATVTRLADRFTRNNIYTNGLITSSGGTWFVELKNNVELIRDGQMRMGIGDTTSFTTNSIYISAPTSKDRFVITKTISGSNTTLFTTTTDNVKIAIKWNGTSADVFVNGVKEVSATVFATTLMENLLNTATTIPVYIQAMQLYPTPLSDSDCISLTTL